MTPTESRKDTGVSDYEQVFGKLAEPWREPLGALRLTLWDEDQPDWTIQRARDEVEWLCRVLNGVTDGSEGPVAMIGKGVEGRQE